MDAKLRAQQEQGWMRAYFQQKKEIDSWKRQWQQERENREQAEQRIRELEKENEGLRQELAAARKTPAWVKTNKTQAAKREAKPLGPKPGHAPHPRRRPTKIDRSVAVVAQHCPSCQGRLQPPSHWHTHVQIDLPPTAALITTEYRIGWSYCPECRHEVSGACEMTDAMAYAQYGPRLHAQVAYWKFALGLTLGKIQKQLKDQYALEISTGELSEMLSRAGRKSQGIYNALKESLSFESHLHADETSWRESASNRWLWSFSNENVSFYVIHPSRGSRVIEEILGEKFDGVLSSDFYAAYNRIQCPKQKCWAHLLRDCHHLKERAPPGSAEVLEFTDQVKRFFEQGVFLRNWSHGFRMPIDRDLTKLKRRTRNWAQCQYEQHPNARARVLARRILRHLEELYLFIEKDLDPTNNAAEREIRPAVLMRKTSYCNRSPDGAKNQAILMSLIRTCSKQNVNFVDFSTAWLAAV